jgi:Zn-finger nucleic acid-binding protein
MSGMKVIVECTKCCRRYNAAGRSAGARFRCHCGESLTVSAPRGHDAAVVRCSSCGAPRENKAVACQHCGSDFTLHERDLDSVCPSCLARVSDKARYCHHCATPLFAESIAGEKCDLTCAICGPERQLVSRRLGGFPIAILECCTCAGLWLGLESLEEMLSTEARGNQFALNGAPASGTDQPATSRGYIRCIICGEFMARRNLAEGKSGIVVDLCGHHGIWFDADELAQLIAWTRTGGLEEVRRDLARLVGSKDMTRKRHLLAKERTTRKVAASNLSPTPVMKDGDANWMQMLATFAAEVLVRKIVR